MLKPLTHAVATLLAAGFMAALPAWSNPATALPLGYALSFSASAQDQGDEDTEEEDAQDAQDAEEEADEEQAQDEDEGEEDLGEDEADTQDDTSADAEDETFSDAEDEDTDEEMEADTDQADEDPWAQDAVVEGDDEEADADADADADEDAGADIEASDADSMEAADAEADMVVEDDYEDDAWASGWDIDEADETDDAIPVDHTLFGNDEVWQVVEEDEGVDADDSGDSVGGNMPSIRTSKRATGKPGSKPPRRPGDDEDTVYSYGGQPVVALSVPWQAQIVIPATSPEPNDKRPAWQRQHNCGGALIAPEWVVTAAHCINQQNVDAGFKVRLGAQDISKGDGVLYRIDRIVRHSGYNNASKDLNHPPNMYANDIALVHIIPDGKPVPIDSRRIRQIPVNRKPLPPAVPVSATGWGVTGSSESANTMNAVLLRVDLQAMPNPVCHQRSGYGPLKIKDAVFCASHPTKSTCRGDSGGPVILTNGTPLLVGLVSWGKKACAGDGRPGVYTRIDRYVQWIDQAMKLPAGRNSLP